MAGGSLLDLGKTQMGKTGSISLTEIHITASTQTDKGINSFDGYDRRYANVNNDYKRVNPYMVNEGIGYARDPVPPPTAPFKLSDWSNYEQWREDDPPIVSTRSFDLTGRFSPEYTDDASVRFAFNTTDAAKSDFDTNGINEDIAFAIYIHECTNQSAWPDGGCLDGVREDPEVDWDPDSGDWTNSGESDTSPITITNLNHDSWHIASLVVIWNDSGESTFPDRVSDPGLTSSLTIGDESPTAASIAFGFPRPQNNPGYAYEHIIFKTAEFVCDSSTVWPSSVSSATDCGDTAATDCASITDGGICNGATIEARIWEVCCNKEYTFPYNTLSGGAADTLYEDKDNCWFEGTTAPGVCNPNNAYLVSYTALADTNSYASRNYGTLSSGCGSITSLDCSDYFDNSCSGTFTFAQVCEGDLN